MESDTDDRRAETKGVTIRYERAAGDEVELEVRDIGKTGMFVKTKEPLEEGKRLTADVRIPGDPHAIAIVGRVVATTDAGMEVKFIDLDDGAREVIGRLLGERERTVMGVGAPAPAPSPEASPIREREPTLTGVAEPAPGSAPGAPLHADEAEEKKAPRPAAGRPAPEPAPKKKEKKEQK
jgi:hypothetical protein